VPLLATDERRREMEGLLDDIMYAVWADGGVCIRPPFVLDVVTGDHVAIFY
jgi:hypothetical protein